MENYTEGLVYVSRYSRNRGGGGIRGLYCIKETKISLRDWSYELSEVVAERWGISRFDY
jgi:hypothetical protein